MQTAKSTQTCGQQRWGEKGAVENGDKRDNEGTSTHRTDDSTDRDAAQRPAEHLNGFVNDKLKNLMNRSRGQSIAERIHCRYFHAE